MSIRLFVNFVYLKKLSLVLEILENYNPLLIWLIYAIEPM